MSIAIIYEHRTIIKAERCQNPAESILIIVFDYVWLFASSLLKEKMTKKIIGEKNETKMADHVPRSES